MKEEILKKLSEVEDPELGINIVDLGLIYDISIEGKNVKIKMTFTTPACPMINEMLNEIKEKLDEFSDYDIELNVVFEPLWNPEMMSKAAKMKMGLI